MMSPLLVDNPVVELEYCCPAHGKRPKDEIKELHTSDQLSPRERHNQRRRENRQYVCLTCKVVFSNPGSWKQARRHWNDSKELGNEHTIIKGMPERRHSIVYGGKTHGVMTVSKEESTPHDKTTFQCPRCNFETSKYEWLEVHAVLGHQGQSIMAEWKAKQKEGSQ